MPRPSPATSSPLLLAAVWAVVILPTAWGLQHTIESALKLFTAPTPAAQSQPAARS